MIVGLTGGIGSGKTTVSNIFSQLGVDIVDADIIARDVVAHGSAALTKIKEKFGNQILLADGTLNRAKLRTIVFNHDEYKQWLNDLLHPLIRQTMLAQLKATTSPYCLLVAPLLLENKLESYVDRVLVIDIPVDMQIERTLVRDTSQRAEIEAIIACQISRADRLAAADDVIDNSITDIERLNETIISLHQQYLLLCQKT